jgi:serine protease inhibitor
VWVQVFPPKPDVRRRGSNYLSKPLARRDPAAYVTAIMKITFVFLVVAFLRGSDQQCLSANDNKPADPSSRLGLYTGQQEFSLALLQAINQLTPHENLFFSPYSTYHALIIAYFLAGGQTEGYLKKMLRLGEAQTKPDVYNAYKLDKLQTGRAAVNNSYEFTNANKIYVADQIDVRSCIGRLFAEELAKVAFKNDPQAARLMINKWVENHTHDMIKDLLPPGSVDQSTTLVLVNAAYFKGKWDNKFNPNETKPEIFYVSPSKQIMVDMMHVEATFNHDVSESLEAHILEMPYKGDQISMYVLLPPFTKEDAIDNTLKKLTAEKFRSIVDSSNLIPKTVQVSFPKFSLEHTIELVPVLEKMGVGDLFQETSDFSTLSETLKGPLGSALHKARIEVNEEGTKAAAATVLFSFRSSRPAEPAQFHCNHPFIYVLYDKVEKAVLFTGVFRRPH